MNLLLNYFIFFIITILIPALFFNIHILIVSLKKENVKLVSYEPGTFFLYQESIYLSGRDSGYSNITYLI